MKFGLTFVAIFAAAGLALRLYFDKKDNLSFWSQSLTPQKVGSAASASDPFSATASASGPLDALSNSPITEAAYHQLPGSYVGGAFGPEENTDGEEVLSLG